MKHQAKPRTLNWSIHRVSFFLATWFINRAGRIEFVQRGFTPSLVEEFSWRIEALR